MSIDIFWRIPTHGENSSLRGRAPTRGDWSPLAPGHVAPGLRDGESDGFAYIDYIAQTAKAAEISGFKGGLIPSFPMTDDPWAISTFLARETKTFQFMIAFQPGFLNPVKAAHMSASLQRATGGRLVFNIITGSGGPQQLWWGDFERHDDRYGRTTEFLDVLKGVWTQNDFSYQGRFFSVEHGGLAEPLAKQAIPEIYFSGSSDAALLSASKHADYYLSWMEPFEALRAKFARVKERTDAIGRKIKCSVRIDIVARPTEEEAWFEIQRGFASLNPDDIAKLAAAFGQSEAVGGQRLASLKPFEARRWDELIVAPNLWGGFSLLRGGPPIGIVGSYEQVAERLQNIIDLGADSFILAGTPHLEEAYRVGEEVLPLLRLRDDAQKLEAAE